MRMSKKRLCMIILITVVVGVLSGCRSDDVMTKEPLTLQIWGIGSSNDAAANRISDVLSEISERDYGFRVKIKLAPYDEYQNALRSALMSGDDIDAFCYVDSSGLMSLIADHYVYPLDYMLNQYPQIKRYVTGEFWPCVTVNNLIYAIPGNNNINYGTGFVARADIVKELGIDVEKINSFEKLHETLLMVKEKYPDMHPVVPSYGQVISSFGEDPLGDRLGVLMDNEGVTVENLYADKEYEKRCRMMRQWYEEGLVFYSMSVDEIAATDVLRAYNGFGYFMALNNTNFLGSIQGTEQEMVYFKLSEPIANTSSVNVGWCISSNSKYKEEAMQLLELLYTNQAASDVCIYGQEEIDYRRMDPNTVTNLEESQNDQWITISWAWPNCQIASKWRLDGEAVGMLPEQGAKRSPAMGFMFNSESVQEEVNYCTTVVNKYNSALLSGYLDPAEVLPVFLEELKAAGIDQVIQEKQKQLDQWLYTKK